MVSARMKDQRLSLLPAVLNHFAEENHVIAAVEFPNHPADEMSGGSLQQRAAFHSVAAIDFGKAIRKLCGESAREMVLVGREDVDRKMARFGEIQIFRGGLAQTPEHERRIERNRCERIYGEAETSPSFGARGNDRDTRGELAQGVAQITVVEGARSFHG